MLDEAEIQRRMSRPRKPTLAELYAQATEPAERERWYADEDRPRAEAVPSRRPRPRPDRTVWVTKPILKARGWTEAAIHTFLPKPEGSRKNPNDPVSYRPMPLWRAETVADAESTTEWRLWLDQSLRRRRLTRDDLTDAITDHDFRHRVQRADAAISTYRNRRV